MGDKKSSKAIRVQWFIPVVPCGSQLIYSIRSHAFEAKRSPEVPNLSFRLLVFKHGALCSSAPPHLPLYSAFCATPSPSAPRLPTAKSQCTSTHHLTILCHCCCLFLCQHSSLQRGFHPQLSLLTQQQLMLYSHWDLCVFCSFSIPPSVTGWCPYKQVNTNLGF